MWKVKSKRTQNVKWKLDEAPESAKVPALGEFLYGLKQKYSRKFVAVVGKVGDWIHTSEYQGNPNTGNS